MLGLYCAYIAKLMTHTGILHMTIYLAIMLLKFLGILQRVTKSQKMHHLSNKKIDIKKANFKKRFCQKIISLYL